VHLSDVRRIDGRRARKNAPSINASLPTDYPMCLCANMWMEKSTRDVIPGGFVSQWCSANWCSGTRTGYEYDLTLRMCGDMEVDVAALSTCRVALPQATCTAQKNVSGVALPSACAALY
jgi:hypothetical protein